MQMAVCEYILFTMEDSVLSNSVCMPFNILECKDGVSIRKNELKEIQSAWDHTKTVVYQT